MSETETTATASANGKTDAKPKAAKPAEPEITAAAEGMGRHEEPCEDCGQGEPGKAATGLGLLICAVAGGLLYIGLDLVTGGGLSRRFGSAREDEEE